MEFRSHQRPIRIIKERENLVELNLEAFIQVLTKNDIVIHGKNLLN